MLGPAQAFHALDLNRWRARAPHAPAHFVEQFRKISYFRLTRGVVNSRRSARQGCRHHQVLSAGHGDLIETDLCTDQSIFGRARYHISCFEKNFSAHLSERRQMQIDRPCADRATAGQRHSRFAEARQQWA